MRWAERLSTMARTADHSPPCRGETVGDCSPGVISTARSRRAVGMS
jgi:hypothetical protein